MKKLTPTILLISSFLIVFTFSLHSQATLEGRVTDETGEGMIAANIEVFKAGVFITGNITDFDGNYVISGLESGTYEVEVTYVGYNTKRKEGVVIKSDIVNKLEVLLLQGGAIDIGTFHHYRPLIEQDDLTHGKIYRADQIKRMPR